MLSDGQLYELAKKMGVPLEAVSFKDELPAQLKYNRGYIINMQNELDDKGLPNEGSHWCAFQIQKGADGVPLPIYFDPFGVGAPLAVSAAVEAFCGKKLPHCTKDVQSLLASCCGYFCMAFLYFVNCIPMRTGHVYTDTTGFLDMFLDLGESHEFKHNELILKTFFRSTDPATRLPIDLGENIAKF